MAEAPRKKSPRAPSMALNEALDRAIKVYEKERLHAAPVEVIANNIGYKSANNGSAMAAIASLRYYGLLERPKEGFLAVSKDVESFRFAPNEELRKELLSRFLKTPPLYADLLEKYSTGLPSDASLRYELIQRGFIPAAAESALAAFKRSVEFVGYYDLPKIAEAELEEESIPSSKIDESVQPSPALPISQPAPAAIIASSDEVDLDRIPVRLPGGRRAWLVIPTPLYESDKARLKAQIDLLLTEDEETNFN